MQIDRIFFPEDIYSQYLDIINGIKFSPREIDVLSCLITARGASKTASLLNISPNTVFSHMRNVMTKLGRNSREGIIDFLEASGKIRFLREYNSSLLVESLFVNLLRDCLKLKPNIPFSDLCILCYDNHLKSAHVNHFRKHLDRAGFEINVVDGDDDQNIDSSREEIQSRIIFVSKKISMTSNSFSEANFLELGEQNDYYLASLGIIQGLSPETNFEILIKNFSKQYNLLKSSISKQYDTIDEDRALRKKKNELREPQRRSSQNKKWGILVGAFSVGVLLLGFQVIKGHKKMQISHPEDNIKELSIRSDMIIPSESGLLHRPEEVSKLDSIFKKQNNIQSIAIMGPGGAGKTILARQYAHQQKAQVIWEMNAETSETLNTSFEDLAYALANTDDSKKRLKEIQEIKILIKKDAATIQFVKDQLKSYSNWFLIYDNVEKFIDIQKYFPQDAATWGVGKIILTTRDKNIQNNNYVNSSMKIQELKDEQKLALFLKIMTDEGEGSFSESQKEDARLFLENIPPYPLDIAIAAYYLKSTRVPYAKYLENLLQNKNDFSQIQKNILKEAGDYTKTRYEIITLSLQNLLNTDQSFGELLIFVSLLGSQDIPRELLEKYKNNVVVDNFIYNLKKYSLITNESSLPALGQTFSLHRSTREVILAYLTSTLKLEKVNVQLHHICEFLNNYAKSKIDEEDLSKIKEIIGHYEAVLSHDNLFSDALMSSIENKLGCMYHCLRFYNKAQQLLEKSLVILEGDPVKNNKKIIETLAYLTTINMELGNHKEAKNILENRLSPYEQYLSSINPEIGWTLVFFGDVSGILGNYVQATTLLEQSYKLYKEHYPTDYLWIARILSLLGNNYSQMGHYEKAKDLVDQGLTIHKKKLVKNHLEHAWTLTYLGNIYGKLGEYEEAKNSLEEGISIAKLYLPENHIDIAWASVYLGNAYIELGEFEEAQTLLEKVLLIHKEVCGDDNIRTASALTALGNVYKGLNNYEKATSFLEKSFAIYEREYGNSHVETARILRDLGRVYLAEGDFTAAEYYLHKALKIFQISGHTDSYMILEDLAQLNFAKQTAYKSQGNRESSQLYGTEAEVFLKQGLAIIKARFPDNSPHIKRLQKKFNHL